MRPLTLADVTIAGRDYLLLCTATAAALHGAKLDDPPGGKTVFVDEIDALKPFCDPKGGIFLIKAAPRDDTKATHICLLCMSRRRVDTLRRPQEQLLLVTT